MFDPYNVPPYFFVFYQNQRRIIGDYKQSAHKFELPGGLRSNKTPNLKYMSYNVDGVNFGRYTSVHQNTVEQGSLMRYYKVIIEIGKIIFNFTVGGRNPMLISIKKDGRRN